MKKFVVHVIEDDIKNGVKKSGTRCPIARACRAAGIERPEVGNSMILFGRRDSRGLKPGRFNNTKKIERFIRDFDDGKHVRPFSFEIRVS